jgi:hypothetical protein
MTTAKPSGLDSIVNAIGYVATSNGQAQTHPVKFAVCR